MAIDSESFLDLNPSSAGSRLQYGNDPLQFGELRTPQTRPPWPVVMNIHGGFWRAKYDLNHAGQFCSAVTNSGIATFNVEYRRVGNPGGGWPGSLDDVRAGYRYLVKNARELGLNESRICIAGHSAGGQLGFCLAAYETDVSNAISLAGVLDLHQAYALHLGSGAAAAFLGGTPEEFPDRYSAASPSNLTIGAKQIVITGTADDIVPMEISLEYSQRKRSSGEAIKLVEIPEADHFDLIDPRTKAFRVVLDSLQRLLF